MKEKLIKIKEFYSLYDTDGNIIASNYPKTPTTKKLSLKNCQAIERGYDLDELVIDYIGEVNKKHWHPVDHNDFVAFKDGFEKALELLGDKKFSEEDIKTAIAFGWDYEGKSKEEMLEIYNINLEYNNSYFEDTQKYIQSLQQTEWNVEIVTFTENDLKSVNEDWGKLGEPKLDENGCLILKRI